jgi:hypothetical protein
VVAVALLVGQTACQLRHATLLCWSTGGTAASSGMLAWTLHQLQNVHFNLLGGVAVFVQCAKLYFIQFVHG